MRLRGAEFGVAGQRLRVVILRLHRHRQVPQPLSRKSQALALIRFFGRLQVLETMPRLPPLFLARHGINWPVNKPRNQPRLGGINLSGPADRTRHHTWHPISRGYLEVL